MARTKVAIDTVIEPEADGLASWIWRLGPNAATTLPDPASCGGQYLLVASGTMLEGGQALDYLSAVYLSPEEPAHHVVAGATGLDLLVLQFPRIGEELTGSARNRAS